MTRLIPQSDMSADQILACCSQAIALVNTLHARAWDIQNSSATPDVIQIADDMGQLTMLAAELLGPVHEALSRREGKAGAL